MKKKDTIICIVVAIIFVLVLSISLGCTQSKTARAKKAAVEYIQDYYKLLNWEDISYTNEVYKENQPVAQRVGISEYKTNGKEKTVRERAICGKMELETGKEIRWVVVFWGNEVHNVSLIV